MGLARQIALPHEFAPERFPSFPALERTAVMGFNVPSTLDLPASTPIKCMLTRQASYPFWAEKSLSGSCYRTAYRFNRAPSASIDTFDPTLSLNAAGNIAATNTYLGITGSNNTGLSSYAIIGLDGDGSCPYTYVPDNWTCSIIVAFDVAPTAAVDVAVHFEVWNSPGQTQRSAAGLASSIAGNYAVQITSSFGTGPIWVRPFSVDLNSSVAIAGYSVTVNLVASAGAAAYAPSAISWGTLTVTPAFKVGMIPAAYPVEFLNSQLPWFSTRTTAAAVLGTNVSQVLNKGGTVLAGRAAPQVINPWLVTETYINGLHPAEKAFLPLETGVYSYCPPSTDLSDFWDYTVNTLPYATINPAPLYRLDNTALVNVMFLTASGVAETLALNVDWHIEFRTSSALFPIGLSTITLETLHQAQIALAASGFFFENPNHKAILDKVISAAKKYGPAAIGLVNPTAGRVASRVLHLSSKPKSQMKSTSAEGSGMSRTKKSKPKPHPPPKKGQGKGKKHKK